MKRLWLLREPVSVAPETLRSHKMRSFLMLLGIILSVSTLIVAITKFPRAPMFPSAAQGCRHLRSVPLSVRETSRQST